MPITSTDIANRACQKVGAELIATGALLTEQSRPAEQIRACYDFVRRAELRRNPWVFGIRVASIRPLSFGSRKLTFGTWVSGTTYAKRDIVTGDDGQVYFSRIDSNTGNTPSTTPSAWTLYFGPHIAEEFITTWGSGYTYMQGDHAIGSDGNSYISLVDTNTNNNPVGDGGMHWAADTSSYAAATTTTFYTGELVHIGQTVYLSLTNNNGQGTVNTYPANYFTGLPPPSTVTWMTMATAPTVEKVVFNYPVGAGPVQDFMTKNVYMLPLGWLREVSQNPKAGQALFLGAPDGSEFNDWNYQGGRLFVSSDTGVINYRFMADIQNTDEFDPMFVDGFACRIALEVCEILTQSTSKLQAIEAEYRGFMGEARTINAIENGPIYPPEDSYITARF